MKKCLINIKLLFNNMSFKIDFPYPPQHYKFINKDNYDNKPNLEIFFK